MDFKRFIHSAKLLLALLLTFLLFSFVYVSISALKKTYWKAGEIPGVKYVLLLGTSKVMNNGKTNLFFKNRCKAIEKLWDSKKQFIKKIIISGDSANPGYDEPELMKEELLKYKIPDSIIVLDKKGFNTMHSLLFCKKNNFNRLIVVSQKFHNERALVIAKHLGIPAVGYNAKPVYTYYGIRVWLREWLARGKLMIELLL